MARDKTPYRCTECGGGAPRWSGRCGQCGAWNCVVEQRPAVVRDAARPVELASVPAGAGLPRPTGIDELDRALAGGLVPGSVTLVSGEPGIGKSTLLLQVAAAWANGGGRALIVSAEESAEQVRRRAERLGPIPDDLALLATTSLDAAVRGVATHRPDLVVVDSVQTLSDPGLGAPGGVSQVRACAERFVELAKQLDAATVIVGHVTKEGLLAGPRVLEHLVDTVCSFEGDHHHALRVLSVSKHRFGPSGELGVFSIGERGLECVADPSAYMLADRRPGVCGSVVAPVLEGRRPILVEVQALVARSALPTPRRAAQGVVAGRLALLLAVLERRVGCPLSSMDVFASAVGGVRVSEPASDLALGLALASAALGRPLGEDLVACGEVGLGGEVRQVSHAERRLAEAARRGFRRAVVPCSSPEGPPGLELVRVGDLAEAVLALSLLGRSERVLDGPDLAVPVG